MKALRHPAAAVARALAVGMAVASALTACGGGDKAKSGASFTRAQADTAIDVTLKDFEFAGLPATIGAGKVFIAATNAGPSSHELEIVDAAGETVKEIMAFPQGGSKTLAVKLPAGTYTVQCLVAAGDKRHADLGMKAQLTVR